MLVPFRIDYGVQMVQGCSAVDRAGRLEKDRMAELPSQSQPSIAWDGKKV